METTFKALNLKRASIKGRVTKFSNQLDDFKGRKITPIEIDILTQRLAKVEALFTEFDGVQNQIESIDEKNLSNELDTREAIEQTFYNSISAAKEIIADNTTSKKSAASFDHSYSSAIGADEDDHEVIGFRLPVIKISPFSGNYQSWVQFRDTFNSLINSNPRIKNIHKFHYLVSYLEGEAARVISNLEVSDANYPEAWNLLCERYNNTRQLINSHLKLLFNIEQARESDKSLRFIVDHITKNLRALKTLKQPTEHWDTVIIYLVSAKLDSNTRVKWEEYIHVNVSSSEMPTLDNFLTFLKARADVLESVFRSKQEPNKSSKQTSNNSQNYKKQSSSFTKSFVVEKGDNSNVSTIYKCVICKEDHRIYECPQFKPKSIDERAALVTKLKLCTNCLRTGHNQRSCRTPGSCKICRRRHSTMICKESESPVTENEQDPKFNEPSDIDLLIGADIFWDVILSKQHSLGKGNPILRQSQLGWLIAGPLHQICDDTIQCNFTKVTDSSGKQNDSLVELHKDLKRFWELESLPTKPLLTSQEKECELHFLKHTKRNSEGRFIVKLPLTTTPDCLGDSYFMAKKRFLNLERRFRKQPEIKTAYVDFINEYAHLGHLSISDVDRPENGYFVPHHPIIRENSESTRLRVVFDASSRCTQGNKISFMSVNDIQMIGPTIQDSLFNILLRFRQYQYVISADIEKMYRQILVHESDRNLQLILWRDAEDKPLQTLRLNTVTYGFASASFLATRCLWQVGEECDDPVIKNIIQTDFYVDDLLTGHDDESQLRFIQQSVAQNLAKAGFNLRKYRSNLPSLLTADAIQSSGNLIISETTNTLGLSWEPSRDILKFPIDINEVSTVTKRKILSSTFKVFDPLGLLSLCTIVPKILIQTLWSLKLDWDDPAPPEIVKSWKNFTAGMESISSLSIPRSTLIPNAESIEMHCFSDASQRAFGACIFLKSVNKEGEVRVNLLCAKSRVAPASTPTTIPRLELSGALLAAEMSSTVSEALRCQISRIVYWTDSSIVLAWIRKGSKNLKTFVANRVATIRELTETSAWHHVPTEHNPADLLSRGVDPREVANCDLWWFGPSFLALPEIEWPSSQAQPSIEPSELPEVKVHVVETNDAEPSLFNIEKYSKLKTVINVFGYVNRFLYNCKNPKNKAIGSLSASERDKSLKILTNLSQRESFPKEYKTLLNGKSLKPKSNIAALNPFIHEGLIRVGGRIQASDYSFDMKHPMLLSPKHHLSKLLFEYEHIKLLHGGPQALLASIRTRFWPIGGRGLARRTVLNCIVCRRFKGQAVQNIMGNLPSERLTPDFPFHVVGTDYAGPFRITDRRGRGCKITKCYLCIFICFKYKCLHLEAVSELSKDAFILTLKRFTARRGLPRLIYCDNGGNYVSAAKEIKDFLQSNTDALNDFAASEGVEFCFAPPYAPHFNGLMEAGVKSAKFHLARILGNTHLTFEELSSLFAQIEAILNSRPLYSLSSSPQDFYPLTPGHFLIGRPLIALPTPCLLEAKETQLDTYRRIERMRQIFWRRWSNEFISELQGRVKWRTRSKDLQVDDLVVLKEDNSPPLHWRLGRVKQLFPGADGVARVADITTARGVVRRAINRICLLPNPNTERVA